MNNPRHYHLIGIGGVGMSAIAKLLLLRGLKVSGSDIKASPTTDELKSLGAEIFIGHRQENLKGTDCLVYSSAIKEDNPELIQGKRQGLVILKRGHLLADLMNQQRVITVTGSHGKTTTTSLVSCLMFEAGLSPTLAIGGILRNIDSNAAYGRGEFFVAEADESDGSFLYYRPNYSIITNIDYEHLDYYQTFENEVRTFKKFVERTQEGGCVFLCGDDPNLRKIVLDYKGRYLFFGLGEDADIYPGDIEMPDLTSSFDCFYKNSFLDRFTINLAGRHNISNSLAVIGLGIELGLPLDIIKKTLADYKGTARRLEIKFKNKDYLVLDDYAHHPTEIKATLSAIKNLGYSRIIAIFQPHRYSRTKLLLKDFAGSFNLADWVIVTDIYAAGESVLEEINAEVLSAAIKKHNPAKRVDFLPKEKIAEYILKHIKPADLIITLGAGDITEICDGLVEGIKGKD